MPQCDVPFHGECPVYDATNSSSYTSAWSDDGASYVVQLACPVPEGTPTLADGNTYAGAVPRPYVFDPRRTTPKDAWNYTAGTTAAYSLLYYSSLPTILYFLTACNCPPYSLLPTHRHLTTHPYSLLPAHNILVTVSQLFICNSVLQ